MTVQSLLDRSEDELQQWVRNLDSLKAAITSLWLQPSSHQVQVPSYFTGGNMPPNGKTGYLLWIAMDVDFIALLKDEAAAQGKLEEYTELTESHCHLLSVTSDQIHAAIAALQQPSCPHC